MNKIFECLEYVFYYFGAKIGTILKRKQKKVAGKIILGKEDSKKYIKNVLLEKEPQMICRFGSVEAGAINEYIQKKLGLRKKYSNTCKSTMVNNAGFFAPKEKLDEMLDMFSEQMLKACSSVNLIAHWNHCERYIFKKYMDKSVLFCQLGGLYEKSKSKNPYTHSLKGKKVLVVHPFEKSIKTQYERKDLVFPNGFLPEFELLTVKAVQTIAGTRDERFSNWFEALEYMKNEIDKIDFDIAIIGCGAYGFLLAEHVKKRGKIALHLGGGAQLLFGIMGKRWEATNKHLINEYWVHPNEEETPRNAKAVENGCYW